MNLLQLFTALGILTGLTTVAGVVYVGVKVKANESALIAQREFIDVQARDIADLKGKLEAATQQIRSLTQENRTLLNGLTQKAEVAALHDLEATNHAETITRLDQTNAVLLRIEEALNRGA
jgi:hypothetical protein